MAENYELAYIDYKNGMKYKDIAERYGVTLNTVKSWKTRKWGKNDDEKGVHTKTKSTKSAHTKKSSEGQQPQRKRSGNPNPSHSFPKHNKAAEVHGFFSKWLPDETLEIMEAMNERSPVDLIWDQIQIQYAAIIRAQRIMFVSDKDEMIKELKKAKYEYYPIPKDEGGGMEKAATEEEYNFQFSWERQAQLLTAQSRAIGELRSSIRQFVEMTTEDDERRLKLEQMQLNIEKTKAEIGTLNDPNNKEKKVEIVIRRKEARD